MTLVEVREHAKPTPTVPVRVVDSDVHPVPRPGELLEHIPEPYRSRHFAAHPVGDTITYDAPGYGHSRAMRLDAFPEGGGFPGSDPELAFRQLILGAGSDIGILEPGMRSSIVPEVSQAGMTGMNHWLDRHWLDSATNWHRRWRGSIMAAIEDPQGAAREIEHWAGHPYMAQVLISAEPRPAWGDPRHDPVWEAATRHDLPVACHLGRGHFEHHPRPPFGWPSHNHDFMVTYSLLAANQIMSLIFDGVFERFPTLKIIMVEHAFTWVLPLMWRLDAVWAARRGDVPQVRRKPSEYILDHLFFSTQPLDHPEDKLELTRAMEMMQADRILLFSTDYPHWTFDDPRWVVKHIPERMREQIMHRNGIALYHLPEQLPALVGQVRPF